MQASKLSLDVIITREFPFVDMAGSIEINTSQTSRASSGWYRPAASLSMAASPTNSRNINAALDLVRSGKAGRVPVSLQGG